MVDCYIARTVEACSHLLWSLLFGCSVDGILRSAFPQIGRSCLVKTFHSTENKVPLHQNILSSAVEAALHSICRTANQAAL